MNEFLFGLLAVVALVGILILGITFAPVVSSWVMASIAMFLVIGPCIFNIF